MKKIVLVVSLITSGAANSASINYLEITSASIHDLVGPVTFRPGEFANMTIGGYDGSMDALNLRGLNYPIPYDEKVRGTIAWSETAFSGDVAIFTAETDGFRSGFAAPTGDITDSTLSLDLSAWTVHMTGFIDIETGYGKTFNLGSSSDMIADSVCLDANPAVCSTAIMTTYNPEMGTFTATWNAVNLTPFGEHLINPAIITIEGYVSTVPVPASVWLLGSGLIGLASFAKRKKA